MQKPMRTLLKHFAWVILSLSLVQCSMDMSGDNTLQKQQAENSETIKLNLSGLFKHGTKLAAVGQIDSLAMNLKEIQQKFIRSIQTEQLPVNIIILQIAPFENNFYLKAFATYTEDGDLVEFVPLVKKIPKYDASNFEIFKSEDGNVTQESTLQTIDFFAKQINLSYLLMQGKPDFNTKSFEIHYRLPLNELADKNSPNE